MLDGEEEEILGIPSEQYQVCVDHFLLSCYQIFCPVILGINDSFVIIDNQCWLTSLFNKLFFSFRRDGQMMR